MKIRINGDAWSGDTAAEVVEAMAFAGPNFGAPTEVRPFVEWSVGNLRRLGGDLSGVYGDTDEDLARAFLDAVVAEGFGSWEAGPDGVDVVEAEGLDPAIAASSGDEKAPKAPASK